MILVLSREELSTEFKHLRNKQNNAKIFWAFTTAPNRSLKAMFTIYPHSSGEKQCLLRIPSNPSDLKRKLYIRYI